MPNDPLTRNAAALVIGVGAYAHDPLQFAAADARGLAAVLADPVVCRFPQDRVKLLTDKEATRSAIFTHLTTWLPDNSRGAELVVIYFAGHGMAWSVGGEEEGYLLPHDGDPRNPGDRGIAMSELAKWMGNLTAKAVIVCLDCCHAGLALNTGMTLNTRDPVPRAVNIGTGAIQKVAGAGRFLMAACSEGQKSHEDPDREHGLFTYHLLEGIKAKGDRDKDGKVGAAELFEYVFAEVVRDASRLGVKQEPWRLDHGVGGVYISTPEDRTPTGPGKLTVEAVLKRLPGATGPELVELLNHAQRLADARLIPFVLPYFTREWPKPVREAARQVLKAVGRAPAFAVLEGLVRRREPKADETIRRREPKPPPLETVLDGLATLPTREDLVELLNRIVVAVTGDLLLKATELRDHKRLGLGVKALAELLAKIRSGYKPVRALGQGQFTVAYLAHDVENDMEVVVRVLRAEFVGSPEACRQFLAACQLSKKHAHHEALVSTFDVKWYPKSKVYFAVRAFVDGATLRDMLTGRPPAVPPHRFTPLEAVEILRQLLGALGVLHAADMVHGEVKPSNVFVRDRDRERGRYRVVLGDVAPAISPMAHGPRPAYLCRYLAPEVLLNEPAGPGADLYALGCVGYELLTGNPPFVADTAGELTRAHLGGTIPSFVSKGVTVPSKLEKLVLRLLMRSPGDRPDAESALAELDAVRELLRRPPDPDSAPPPTGPAPGSPDPNAPPPPAAPVAASVADYRPVRTLASAADDRSLAAFRLVAQVEQTNNVPALPPGAARPTQSVFPFPPDAAEGTRNVPALPSAPDAAYHTQNVPARPVTPDPAEGTQNVPSLPPVAAADATHRRDAPAEESRGRAALPTRIGRFEIRQLIGEGAFARVYLGFDPQLDRLVAIKVHKTEGLTSEFRERFLREARATAAIHHPNVCPVYEVGAGDGLLYIVMHFVAGGTLAKLLCGGTLPVRGAVAIARKLALGLAAAHERGVIHRDMKPANVLYDEARREVLIADFGLARLDDGDGQQTREGQLMGTPAYMSPEQAQGRSSEVGPLSDVYSLGVILYEMLTGRPPFQGGMWELLLDHIQTPPQLPSVVRPGLDPRLDAICLTALAKRPAGRFPSARAMADALSDYLRAAEEPPPPDPAPRASRLPNPTVFPSTDPELSIDARGGARPADDIPFADEVFDLDPEPDPPPPSLWGRLTDWFRKKP